MCVILIMLKRLITLGYLTFKIEEVVPTEYFWPYIRPFADEPDNFSSGIGCFIVSQPDVLILFLNY